MGNPLYSFVYRQAIPSTQGIVSGKVRARLFQQLRKFLLRFADPEVEVSAHGAVLHLPFSHQLPFHLARAPLCDSLLLRLTIWVRARDGEVRLVDVGANVGIRRPHAVCSRAILRSASSPATFIGHTCNATTDREPGQDHHGRLLGGGEDSRMVTVEPARGTGRLREGNGGGVRVRPLPALMEETGFERCNLLKIDTDGHDLDCVLGARAVIEKQRPAVLFEADIFDDRNYAVRFEETLAMLAGCGYTHFLVYTNVGHLFGVWTPQTLPNLLWAVFYQVTSRAVYYDVLALCDPAGFLEGELDFFSGLAPDDAHRAVAESLRRRVCRDAAFMAGKVLQ